MELTIYARKREANGKKFFLYSTTLKKKDGTEERVSVKFREDCGSPDGKKCPMNIVVSHADMNLARGPRLNRDTNEYVTDNNGEVVIFTTLWITKWKEGSKFVDHSLDDYITE